MIEWQNQYSILRETNEEHLATNSSLTKVQVKLDQELRSSLTTLDSLKEKNRSLTPNDHKWNELVDTIEKDKKGATGKEFRAIKAKRGACRSY